MFGGETMIEEKQQNKDLTHVDNYLKDRVVFMEGEFNLVNCNRLKKELLYLYAHNSKEPITIFINSNGGSVYGLNMLWGILQKAPCKIKTVALGYAMSAGADLLLMGDERMAYPNTTIMFHGIQTWMDYSNLSDIEDELTHCKNLENELKKLMIRKTKLSKAKIDEIFDNDIYYNNKEAFKYGIINKK